MSLHLKNTEIIDAIAAATGIRSALTTTDKTTFVAAINEIKNAQNALGTVEHSAADITARDALSDVVAGDMVFVTDASADGTVTAGWAIYRVQSTGPFVFLKMAEQESLDVAMAANLAAGTVTGTTVEVTIDTGSNVVLAGANATDAGLMVSADKVRHDEVSVEVADVSSADYTAYVATVM